MEIRMIVRDKKRLLAIATSLLLVVLAVSGSIIASEGSLASVASEALKRSQPNIEIEVSAAGEAIGNSSYTRILDSYRQVGYTYSRLNLDKNAISMHGSLIYTPVAVHYILKKGCIQDGFGEAIPVSVDGKTVYYAHLASIISNRSGSSETLCLYKLSLGIVTPLEPSPPPKMRIVEGRLPVEGKTPIEAAVYTGFAEYMGWRTGDVVEFLGSKLKITGLFTYTGGYDTLTEYDNIVSGSYPVLIIGFKDLSKYLANISKYTFSLLQGYSRDQARAFGIILGILEPAALENVSLGSLLDSLPSEGILPHPWIPAVYNYTEFGLTYRSVAKLPFATIVPDVASKLILYGTVPVDTVFNLIEEARGDSNKISLFIENKVIRQLIDSLPQNISWTLTVSSSSSGMTVSSTPASNSSKSSIMLKGRVHEDISFALKLMTPGAAVLDVGFLIIVVTISVFIIGYLSADSMMRISLADLRRYLAVLVARGAPNSRIGRRLLAALIMLSLASLLIGNLFSIYTIGEWSYESSGFKELEPAYLVKAKWLWILPALTLALIILLTYRSSEKMAAGIRPVEAVRPLETVRRSMGKRRNYGSLLISVFALASLAVILGGGPERIVNKAFTHGTMVAAVAIVISMLGVIGLPFSPPAASYIIVSILKSSNRFFKAASRLSSSFAGRLKEASFNSSIRLGDRMKEVADTSIMAFSTALGSIFAATGFSSLSRELASLYSTGLVRPEFEEFSAMVASSVAGYIFEIMAVFASLVGVLALYVAFSSTFKLVESEVLILRARGASRRDALGFVYGMLLSNSIVAALTATIAGAAFWFMSLGTLWVLTHNGTAATWSLLNGLLQSLHSPTPWILLTLIIIYVLLLPLVVSYRIVRVRDIARLLRARGLG